jgi:hypothetical protein
MAIPIITVWYAEKQMIGCPTAMVITLITALTPLLTLPITEKYSTVAKKIWKHAAPTISADMGMS